MEFGKDIAAALGNISDEKLGKAMQVYDRKRATRSRLIRFAALAATVAIVLTAMFWPGSGKNGLVTAPGVLKVYAYDNTESTAQKTLVTNLYTGAMKYEPFMWRYFMNAYFGIPVSIELPEGYFGDAKITYDLHTDIGEFVWYKSDSSALEFFGTDATINNGDKIAWTCFPTEQNTKAIQEKGCVYIEVIIRADDTAVGYAVLEIGESEDWFFPVRAETVCYPMIDGEYQDVSEIAINLGIEELEEVCTKEYTLEEKRAEYRAYIKEVLGERETTSE